MGCDKTSKKDSQSSEDPIVAATWRIVSAPASNSIAVRYRNNLRKYEALIQDILINPRSVDAYGELDRDQETIYVSLKLVLHICGPKEDRYEGCKASSTVVACKSATVSF